MEKKHKNTDTIKIGGSKVTVKDFKKWLKALRSGKYSQTKSVLRDDKGFCCLGVACDIFIPKDKREVYPETGFLKGVLPSYQIASPEWLRQVDNDFGRRTEHKRYVGQDITVDENYYSLASLNDTLDFTFEEIADTLEAVYLWGYLSEN